MNSTPTLKQVSQQLGISHRKLLNQLKRDGYAKATPRGPVPVYPKASAECLQRIDTCVPIEVSSGVINKRGVTIGVTAKGIDFLAKTYGHMATSTQ